MAPKFTGMGQSDDREIRALQENIRILQDQLAGLQSTQSGISATPPKTDNLIELNFLKKEHEQLRWEFDHLPESAEAGDTYDSYFEITYDGTGNSVFMSTGYILFPGTTEVTGQSIPVNVGIDGTHYIYINCYKDSGSWQYEIVEDTTIPDAAYLDVCYAIAEFEVVSGSIDGGSIIQHQFGELLNPPGLEDDIATNGYFVVQRYDDTSYTMTGGRVIHGTSSEIVAAEVTPITVTGDGTHYVFIEMSDNLGWTYSIDESLIYPVQTATYEYVVLATIVMSGGVITSVTQLHYGEIHSTRLWD